MNISTGQRERVVQRGVVRAGADASGVHVLTGGGRGRVAPVSRADGQVRAAAARARLGAVHQARAQLPLRRAAPRAQSGAPAG